MIIVLWLNQHRMLVVWVLALSMWFGAYGWYFRNPIRFWLMRGQPHNWSIDMVNKKAISRGVEQV